MSKLLDVLNSPWAIAPEKLEEIQGIYLTHLRGDKIDIPAIEARLGRPLANEPKTYEVIDGVAVLPMEGVVGKRMNLFSQISGGMSTEMASRSLAQAAADPNVHSIIQYVDSPGGAVDGTQNYAQDVYAVRGKKPIVTLASGVMASAAYWFGAAADKIYISDLTTTVGQIGVVTKHVDISAAEEKAGRKTTEVAAGKYKRVVSSYKPLDAAGEKHIQEQVDAVYSVFVADVAKFRGVSEETVVEDMAEGRIFIGQAAIDAGLVDGVSTLDDLIAQLNRDRAGSAQRPAFKPNSLTGASMDLEKLKADHSALYQAVLVTGATAERERIQAVEAALIPGHEKLIATLKFDGKTSGGDAALAVNAAERGIREAQGKANNGAAPQPVANVPAATVPPAGGDDKAKAEAERVAALPVDERCKAMWDANTGNVRGDFVTLADYTAYTKAAAGGKVKVIGRNA